MLTCALEHEAAGRWKDAAALVDLAEAGLFDTIAPVALVSNGCSLKESRHFALPSIVHVLGSFTRASTSMMLQHYTYSVLLRFVKSCRTPEHCA